MKRIPCHIITAALAALVGLAPLTRAEHKNPYVGLYGQSLKAKTQKPNFFGNRKTTYKGHNPFNFFQKKDDKKK